MQKPLGLTKHLGALADPESFERERAVYNALNNKIRNLLLSYSSSYLAHLKPTSLSTLDIANIFASELSLSFLIRNSH